MHYSIHKCAYATNMNTFLQTFVCKLNYFLMTCLMTFHAFGFNSEKSVEKQVGSHQTIDLFVFRGGFVYARRVNKNNDIIFLFLVVCPSITENTHGHRPDLHVRKKWYCFIQSPVYPTDPPLSPEGARRSPAPRFKLT